MLLYNSNNVKTTSVSFQAVASTILNYRKLKLTRSEGDNKPNVSGSPYLSLLLEAWKPISVGHKRR